MLARVKIKILMGRRGMRIEREGKGELQMDGVVSPSITLPRGFGKGQTHPEPHENHPKSKAEEWFDSIISGILSNPNNSMIYQSLLIGVGSQPPQRNGDKTLP